MSSRCESRLVFDTPASSSAPDRDVADRPVPAKPLQVAVPAWDVLRLCKESGEAFDRSEMGERLFLFQYRLPVLLVEGSLGVEPLLRPLLINRISRGAVSWIATTRKKVFRITNHQRKYAEKDGVGAGLTPLYVVISAEYSPISD